jgi:uncharacterized protein YhbP (UPF0306 family)
MSESAAPSRPSTETAAATARAIIDAKLYLVLGTADEQGRPWVSPVYYAPAGYHEFFWVSRPDAVHSRNLRLRPAVSIVVFDSSAPIGTGQGVYMTAVAEEVAGDTRATAIDLFSRRSLGHGGSAWALDDVQHPAQLRLYCTTATAQYILGPHDRRVEVRLDEC